MTTKRKETPFWQTKGFKMMVVFFLFVLVLTFVFGDRGILEIIRAGKEIRQLEQAIDKLQAEKKQLSDEVQELRDNPLALERRAREKLWLMKKNEKVVVFIKDRKEGKHE